MATKNESIIEINYSNHNFTLDPRTVTSLRIKVTHHFLNNIKYCYSISINGGEE